MPRGWKETAIGEIAELVNGRGFKPHEWKKSGLPIIRIQNLNGGGEFNYYDGDYDPKIEVHTHDLLYAWSGSRGTSFGPHIWKGPKGVLNYHTWKVRPNERLVDKQFLLYLLKQITTKIENDAHGASALVHMQKWAMEEYKVQIPANVNEQEKIAKILSTWDEAIEKLDQVIERKEKRLQGFGQKLLFNGTNKYRLDDLCTPKQWKTISSKELLDDGIPVFGANSWIGFYSEANHQEDCIAVTCRGATCGTVNYVKGPSYITGNSMALDSLKNEIIDRNFLYFYLRTLGLNSIISGSAQPQITGAAIGKVELTLPTLADQIKVSSILMDATKEVDGFKKLRDKITTQKQGLMQQLLTGKKRVKV